MQSLRHLVIAVEGNSRLMKVKYCQLIVRYSKDVAYITSIFVKKLRYLDKRPLLHQDLWKSHFWFRRDMWIWMMMKVLEKIHFWVWIISYLKLKNKSSLKLKEWYANSGFFSSIYLSLAWTYRSRGARGMTSRRPQTLPSKTTNLLQRLSKYTP